MTADFPAVPDGLDTTGGLPPGNDPRDDSADSFADAVSPRRRRRGRRGGQRRGEDSSVRETDSTSSGGVSPPVSHRAGDSASLLPSGQDVPQPEGGGSLREGPTSLALPEAVTASGSEPVQAGPPDASAATPERPRRRRRGGRGRGRQGRDVGLRDVDLPDADPGVSDRGVAAQDVVAQDVAAQDVVAHGAGAQGAGGLERREEHSGGDARAHGNASEDARFGAAGDEREADGSADAQSSAVAVGPAGSTRLASSRARSGGRRRDRGLTEEQKRMLRETTPDKRMVVTEAGERTQIAVVEGRSLVEHYVTRTTGRLLVGNIYLGRVHNVLPGMEAAFVDIGQGRNGVLYAGEVTYNEEDLEGEAPRIERALKPGQPVVVQVTKDSIGAKGPRLTTQISLAGRYVVTQPGVDTFGISRRLPDVERARLRAILKELRPPGTGVIVRTAAEGASPEDLAADIARLGNRWEQVEDRRARTGAPSLLYAEPELVVRVIRDIFTPDYAELVVDAPALYEQVVAYLGEVAPDLLPKVRRHEGPLPAFEHYHLTEQLHKALERKVWLPSGGSIVIDQTEAMTVVDVNTGRFVGSSNLEETVVAANLEAADEIVRQLRLRDIGGIIVVDFIDMLFEQNQQAVVERLRTALARGKTKSQVMDVGPLGLVQMTRKRVSGGLLESFSDRCPTCSGRGIVINHQI